jgi:uncharacterized protein (DUF433 family)
MTTEPVETIPIRMDAGGTARIGAARVTLDVVAGEWFAGATPEQIVEQYPTLELADIYAVIAWMLRHPAELAQYLADGKGAEDETCRRIEATGSTAGLRAQLLARRANSGDG